MRQNRAVAKARDVSAVILEAAGPIDQMKLQKLLYYGQGWYLAWYNEPLFVEAVEAWTWGPAVADVYRAYKKYHYDPIPASSYGNPAALDDRRQNAIRAVVAAYNDRTGPQLAALTHDEEPWLEARKGLEPNRRSNRAISRQRMKDHFREQGVFGNRRAEIKELPEELVSSISRGEEGALARALEQALGVKVDSIRSKQG